MEKKDIIEKIKEYPMVLDDTYRENDETYYIICHSVAVNNFCCRNIRKLHFCGETLWIGEGISIDCGDVESFRISFMSCRHNKEDVKIISTDRDDFELKK